MTYHTLGISTFRPMYVCVTSQGKAPYQGLRLEQVTCSLVLSSKVHFSDNLVKKYLYLIFCGLHGALSGQLLPYVRSLRFYVGLVNYFFFTFQKKLFVASNGALSGLAHYLQLQLRLATK